MEETTRIARIYYQHGNRDLLQQVSSGDFKAAITVSELVRERCFDRDGVLNRDMLLKILFASVAGFSKREREIRDINSKIKKLETKIGDVEKMIRKERSGECVLNLDSLKGHLFTMKELVAKLRIRSKTAENARREIHLLAGLTANKLAEFREDHEKGENDYLTRIHEKLRSGLINPEQMDINMMYTLARIEMVLFGEKIVKNGSITEMAEAVADGLSKTTDEEKREIMKKLGEAAIGRFSDDKKRPFPSEEQRSYEAVFILAEKPTTSESSPSRMILQSVITRHEDKDNKIRITDSTVSRIRRTLDPKPKQYSDGDLNMPTSHVGAGGQMPQSRDEEPKQKRTFMQRAKELIPFVKKKGNRLAFAGRR